MNATTGEFDSLLQPGRIGTMTLKNRIIMPAMATEFATVEGYVTSRQMNYYAARAKGGVGMIIVEVACIDYPVGKGPLGEIGIDHDKYLSGLAQLAEVTKKNGARVAIQLNHAGRSATRAVAGVQPVAPSAAAPPGYETPRELTIDEVHGLVDRFASAAERARKAGFDGVEIHGAHLYLIAQFLSSAWNRRRDIYGGSLKSRARLLIEIIEQSRSKVGRDYPLWVRLNGEELGVTNGITLEETEQVARWAEASGADAIHVTAWGEGPQFYRYAIVPMTEPEGVLLPLAAAVKKAVSVPVIAVGRIRPTLGEAALRDGKADFISMGRALIADPELPQKLASGKSDDIRPCLSCNYCMDTRRIEYGIQCQVNGAVGMEGQCGLSKAAQSRKVLVIGGGPGGMEAARVARLRGHRVALLEKEPQLGGQLLLAAVPPHKETLSRFTGYLTDQMAKLGVEVRLSTEATLEAVKRLKPDAIIVATGVVPFVPPIPGLASGPTVLAEGVLGGKETGARVVVIGGEVIGCEVAEYLATRGKSVTICEVAEYVTETGSVVKRDRFADKLPASLRARLLYRLGKLGVSMLGGVKYESYSDGRLLITTPEGKRVALFADTLVIAAGGRPNTSLYEQLKAGGMDVHLVGDCVRPRRIGDAVREGLQAGLLV